MSSSPLPVTVATLAAFSDAWNRHDIDALTGLYNRQAYDRLVPIEMERATVAPLA